MTLTCVREDALRLIANGKTAAMAARAANPSAYDHYRTAAAFRAHVGDDLAKFFTHLVPGNALAAETAAFDARLASAMAELEAEGHTPETARAALREAAAA